MAGLRLKCTKFDLRDCAPDPAGGTYSTPLLAGGKL